MEKYIIRAILVIVALAVTTASAHACSCADPSVRQKFRSANVVFFGQIIDKWNTDNIEITDDVKFRVEKRWKGVAGREINVLFYFDSPGTCNDLPLTKGERYLIYAYYEKEGLVSFLDCGPNLAAQYATDEIKKLDSFWFRMFARLYPFPRF